MAEKSLITEQMRKAVGSLLNINIARIEQSNIDMFVAATTDSNPLWTDEEYGRRICGGVLVPPGLLITMQMEGETPSLYMPYMLELKGAVEGGGEWEFFRPVRVGDVIVVERRFVDLYEKSGSLGKMLFNVFETTYRNQRGEIVAKGRWSTIRFAAPDVKD